MEQRRVASESMAEWGEVEWKNVQELAESGRGFPDRFVQREEDRPIDARPPPAPFPVVDLSRLFQPDGADEAARLRSALDSWGMFQAICHEMPASFLDELLNVTREFFQLPVEVKQKYTNLKEGKEIQYEGYGNDRVASEDQILDWTDRLYLVVQPEDARKLDLWPEDPNFRGVLQEFTIKARKVAEDALRAMAKLLELDESYFLDHFGDRGEASARFNYYPSCSRPELVFGIKPHSDSSVITIILPDKDVEGLQILKDGEWIKVPTVPYAVLIALGDGMEIMSNGIFKSPVHRVVTNSEMERISVAMFYTLQAEKELGPAPALVDEMRPRLYKTMKTGEFTDVYFQNFAEGKRTINWVKI